MNAQAIAPKSDAERRFEQVLSAQLRSMKDLQGRDRFTPDQVLAHVRRARTELQAIARHSKTTLEQAAELATRKLQEREKAPQQHQGLPKQPAEQPAQRVAEASKVLSKRWAEMAPEERARAFFIDKNTGALHARAFRRLPDVTERPLVAHVSIEGTKWRNRAGHLAGNELYRAAARALHIAAPEAFVSKVGGDFGMLVRSEKELREILARAQDILRDELRAANPALADRIEGLQFTGVAEPRGTDIMAAFKEAGACHTKAKQLAETAGAAGLQLGEQSVTDEQGHRVPVLPPRAERGAKPYGIPVADAAALAIPSAPVKCVVPKELQAEFEAMPLEQSYREVHVDPTAPVLTGEAFFALKPKAYVASIDLNGLKQINRDFGEAVGDEVLKIFSEIGIKSSGGDFDLARLSGDEYAAQSNDREKLQAFIDLLGNMCDTVRAGATRETGINGITFGYGIEADYDRADRLVEGHKQRGVEAERADRALRTANRLDERARRPLVRRAPDPTQGRPDDSGSREADSASDIRASVQAWHPPRAVAAPPIRPPEAPPRSGSVPARGESARGGSSHQRQEEAAPRGEKVQGLEFGTSAPQRTGSGPDLER